MFYFYKSKHFLLILISFLFYSSSTNCLIITNKNNNINEEYIDKRENYNFFRKLSYSCATTSYSKKEIQEECEDGPSSYDRILKYSSFSSYLSSNSYHSNGLNYVTSLLVDDETHHFGNFMNDGAGMIILYILAGLMFLGWIPILICWCKRCCLFDECFYKDDCCICFWHILTYFLAAAIFSFLIVILCFGE